MDRRQLAKELRAYNQSQPYRLINKLLVASIETLRHRNDTAPADEVTQNQGAIKELKSLLKDLKMKDEVQQHDGAFHD